MDKSATQYQSEEKHCCKISVIMSVFNETEDEIEKAICSVLDQTESDFEFIIVNDNPERKEYINLLSDYADKDDRIIIIHNQENIGLAASMNKALSKAKGELIARMDADDITMPSRFQKEAELLKDESHDVVFTNYTRIGTDDGLLDDGKKACIINSEQSLIEQIVFNGIVHHPTIMMKREAILSVKGYRLFPCSQDQDLWIRMLENGVQFAFLDEILHLYRIREGSISKKRGFQQYLTIQYILSLLKERIENSGKDSYSVEAYQQYIEKRCSDTKEMNRYASAIQSLKAAKQAKENGCAWQWLVQRCKAFCISKSFRRGYLFRIKNRKKVITYLENKGSKLGGKSNCQQNRA